MNGFKKLREVFCPVLEFREEKRTFAKVEGGNADFFLNKTIKINILDQGKQLGSRFAITSHIQ
jgi:hypothetical protein